MSLLVVRELRKTYNARRSLRGAVEPTYAVRNVSFDVDPGETLALVGESGAGKSTTGRLVLRLEEPDEGEIHFDGVDLRALGREELRQMRSRMQMIFQDPYTSLDPRIPIGESVAEPLLVLSGLGRAERLERAAGLLERVGLSTKDMARLPNSLSGGQLQRVSIARALTVNPSLIVCDEPVASLDVSVRAQVLNLMSDLQQEFGTAYLFISHDLSLVRVFADRIAVMRAGEIVEIGAAADVYDAPNHEYTAELLAAVPTPTPKRTFPETASQRHETPSSR